MEDKQEILKALALIQNICRKQEKCGSCPFCMDDSFCQMQGQPPENWKLNNTEPIWRAFK